MPTINRPCRNRGCPNSYPCADHPDDKQYDKQRGSSSARGYDRRWQLARRIKLSRDPLCERCLPKVTAAVIVHHILPVDTHPELRLEMNNLQSMCFNCHEIIEGRKVE